MKKVGLVISGGGSKTIAFLGIIEVLQKHNIKIDHIVTSSMGSLLGVLVANNIPVEEIKKALMRKSKFRDWMKLSLSKHGFISQHRIIRILDDLIPNKKLEDASIPITIVGANINRLTEHLFSEGDAVTAVCASCAYPFIYKPVILGNKEMIADGGILNNVPADICRRIIGSDGIVVTLTASSPFDTSLEALNSRGEIMYRIIYGPLEIQREKVAEGYSDIIIRPFEHQWLGIRTWKKLFNFFDVKLMEHFYELGRKKGEETIEQIIEKTQ